MQSPTFFYHQYHFANGVNYQMQLLSKKLENFKKKVNDLISLCEIKLDWLKAIELHYLCCFTSSIQLHLKETSQT